MEFLQAETVFSGSRQGTPVVRPSTVAKYAACGIHGVRDPASLIPISFNECP